MKLAEIPQFYYPNLYGQGQGRCSVDVYRAGPGVLVVLRDQDDHAGTSVTNALEAVARKVRREVLIPEGLDRMETRWIHWSRTDRIASTVEFHDPVNLAGPRWAYLRPEEFARILAGFKAPDQLKDWVRAGTLEFKTLTEVDEAGGGGRAEESPPKRVSR